MVDMLGLPATGMEYLCGLVHDIGKLVLAELYPARPSVSGCMPTSRTCR